MSCPSDPSVFGAPATERGRSGPAAGLEGAFLRHAAGQSKTVRVRLFTKTRPPPTRHPKRNVRVSSPQRGGTPKPRVRLPGPVGRGAAPWGVDDSAIATGNGVEQNAVAHETRPDSPPGRNGGRAWGNAFGWGHVGLVAPRWGAFSTPHAVPRVRPHTLRRGGRTLGFGVPPRCGEEPARRGVHLSLTH